MGHIYLYIPISAFYSFLGIFLNPNNQIIYINDQGMKTPDTNLKLVAFRIESALDAQLSSEAKTLRVTKSELVRRRLRSSDSKIINTVEILNALESVVAEQARVNNNINQLAKHANINRERLKSDVFQDHNSLMQKHLEFRENTNKILKHLYQVIK
tara:strand:+ start:2563 stop:3030 length:468 start_codon:yes stop_codon:yes gene_type:complete